MTPLTSQKRTENESERAPKNLTMSGDTKPTLTKTNSVDHLNPTASTATSYCLLLQDHLLPPTASTAAASTANKRLKASCRLLVQSADYIFPKHGWPGCLVVGN